MAAREPPLPPTAAGFGTVEGAFWERIRAQLGKGKGAGKVKGEEQGQEQAREQGNGRAAGPALVFWEEVLQRAPAAMRPGDLLQVSD